MVIRRIELTNFRNYTQAAIDLNGGTTAVVGMNGQGKTSLAEAMSYLSTLKSFRGVPNEVLIRDGTDTAYVRAHIVHDDGREILVEAELNRTGRNKVLVNKQRLARTRDLLGVVRSTVFAPGDLDLVYAGPAARRDLIDDAIVSISPRTDAVRSEVERIIKQRNVLLKQSHGRLTPDIEMTLDVWDEKFVQSGTQLGEARASMVARLTPYVVDAYESLAGQATALDLMYEPEWRRVGLGPALAQARNEDIRRGVSSVGPHRDDVALHLKGMVAKTHASQGECRTLALALRLAIHKLVTEAVGEPPLLVLDDVLSELDPSRCTALLEHMPKGQVVITTAQDLPSAAHPNSIIHISGGRIVDEEDSQ